jgi:four helix bundle protein
MIIKSYRDLKVWQFSKQNVIDLYGITNAFPKDEIFGLRSQIRRSAVSIPSNIAEGHARNSAKEFMHFLSIALGSLAELETQLDIALELNFISKNDYEIMINKYDEVGKMLRGLKNSLNTSP